MTWIDLRAEIAELFDPGPVYEDALIDWAHGREAARRERRDYSAERWPRRESIRVTNQERYRTKGDEYRAARRARYAAMSANEKEMLKKKNAARYQANREAMCAAERERYKRKKASNGPK